MRNPTPGSRPTAKLVPIFAATDTPKADIDMIRERLKVAEQFAKEISR